MKDYSKEIRAYALKNAIEHEMADASAILPKLFRHGLDKKDVKKIIPDITKAVKEVNDLKKDEREKEFFNYKKYIMEREEKEKELPELSNTGKGIVVRLPPEPSKYLHLGHALSFLVNSFYAEKYGGKVILRFEDANPEKVEQEYVDAILDDIKNYLKIKISKTFFVSDDMLKLYSYGDDLINKNKAYACFCEREKMQDYRHEGKECECRSYGKEKNLEEWNKIKNGEYEEGKAVLRLVGDMKSLNHVMRDPVLFRIVKAKHFRQGNKYNAWPTYDFYNPITDSLEGVTHILRSNEFDSRIELHNYIKKILGLNEQSIMQYGRFNVIGAETKGRDIRERIESGEYSGWDDPRLVTLKTLRRRGIQLEVLNEIVQMIGLSKKEIKIDFAMIAAISRKMLDKKVMRYYFVSEHREIKIEGMPEMKEIEVKVHPDKDEIRKIKVGKEIFVSGKDFDEFYGKEVRLMNLCNIKIGKRIEFTGSENKAIQKIQWVSDFVKARIRLDDGNWLDGLAEKAIEKLKIGDIVQFERFGFCRLDGKVGSDEEKIYEFWFSHR